LGLYEEEVGSTGVLKAVDFLCSLAQLAELAVCLGNFGSRPLCVLVSLDLDVCKYWQIQLVYKRISRTGDYVPKMLALTLDSGQQTQKAIHTIGLCLVQST